MKSTHTTMILNSEGQSIEVELELNVNPAEHDVGIMGNWIDEWEVASVEGNTNPEACREAEAWIEAEYGDEKFLEKIFEEGAADIDYEPYEPFDD